MSKIIGAMFQNNETGVTQFVDKQQIKWGFEDNNPRLDKCFDVYDQKELQTQLAEKDAYLKEAMEMLDNVIYWESCPEDYKERIHKLTEAKP